MTLRGGKVIDKQTVHTPEWKIQYPSDVAKNPPPPMGVTKETYDKIDKGMAAPDLFDLLGKPPGVDAALAAGANLNLDFVGPDGKKITVLVVQGKVASKENTAGWPTVYPSEVVKNPPAVNPDAGVTQANFDKIAKGMTAKEVNALVGSPTAKSKNRHPGGDGC